MEQAYKTWCGFNRFTPTLGGALYLIHKENERSLAYQLFKQAKWTAFCMMWPGIFAAALVGRE